MIRIGFPLKGSIRVGSCKKEALMIRIGFPLMGSIRVAIRDLYIRVL